jgi:D-alanyl-D-alanine carboxypeptidase
MLFDIGSIVKSFEAAYTLRLAENDRIDLDDPVSAYLPPHSGLDGSISIRQLLNHTSGLFNVFEHPDFPWVDPEVEYSRWWDWEDVLDTFVSDPYGSPGAVQHYSSTNYLLLTVILDELTGESAATGIEQVFLTPMGLEDTFISMGEPPGPDFVVAHPWVDQDQDGTMEDLYGIPLTWKVSLSHPVAFSTALDMANWMYALYHQKSVLNPYSLSQMLTFPEVIDDEQDGRRYGLGVVDYSDLVEVGAIGHTGSSLGYSAAALYLPDYGVTVAWLINRGESPAEWAGWLMNRIWWALFEVIDENLLPIHKH